MWALASLAALAAAIAAHATLRRAAPHIGSLAGFLLVGSIGGTALAAFLLWEWRLGVESWAGVASYAFACELYIFLFSSITSSLSASILYRLRARALSALELQDNRAGKAMVEGRLARMVSGGVLKQTVAGYALTTRGRMLLGAYRRGRSFFRRMPPAEDTPATQRMLARLFSPEMLRWWIVGFGFVGVNIGLLYVLVDLLGLPVLVATLIAAEGGLLLRFVVNDRWVFRQSQITLQRLWQYHVAMASSFAVWWVTTNAIVLFGGHYMVATVIGMACSILISICTNFFWIWTRPKR